MTLMRAGTTVLILSLIGSLLAGDATQIGRGDSDKPEASKTFDCAEPDGYSVIEGQNPGTHDVNIIQGGKVFWTIRLPTDLERPNFSFNWAKKTKAGFEISVQYGSRYFYAKHFNFICKQHKFYLSKIIVESFDKHHPEKWHTKVIRVKPNLPLEKFLIDDFMLEGVVQKRRGL